MTNWNTDMSAAPKDRPVLLWNDPDHNYPNCGYCGTLTTGSRLCLYHAHAESCFHAEVGPVVGVWGGGFDDSTYEEPNAGWLPDWWMLHDGIEETALNPIAWAEIPLLHEKDHTLSLPGDNNA